MRTHASNRGSPLLPPSAALLCNPCKILFQHDDPYRGAPAYTQGEDRSRMFCLAVLFRAGPLPSRPFFHPFSHNRTSESATHLSGSVDKPPKITRVDLHLVCTLGRHGVGRRAERVFYRDCRAGRRRAEEGGTCDYWRVCAHACISERTLRSL